MNARKKLVTVHLPIDLSVMLAIQEAIAPLIDTNAAWGDVVESTGDALTFYAPAEGEASRDLRDAAASAACEPLRAPEPRGKT